MPDYDLGRAKGEILITADTRGADEATASVASMDAQTAALNKTLGDTNRTLGTHETAIRRTSDAAGGYQQRVRDLEAAESKLKATLLDSNATAEDVARARRGQSEAARNAADAENALRDATRASAGALTNMLGSLNIFNRGTGDARKGVQGLSEDLKRTEENANKLASTLTTTLTTALKAVAMAGAVGVGGGALGLLGAGGASGITNVLAGSLEVIKDFSGAIALLPALAGGAATSLGVLAVSFGHVGDALKAMDDPTKFNDALRKMAPAAQQVVKTIASFSNAFESAERQVQQSFFQPLINDIQPLITTWLPQLMKGGQQVAGAFGGLAHTLAGAFQDSSTQQGFTQFIGNLTNAIKALDPAIKPIVQAFTTLGVIGSESFGRLATAVTKVANEFNQWVQAAAANGDLDRWINRALTSFDQLWQIIKNVGEGINNVLTAGDKYGGGFLSTLVQITAEFNKWSSSVKGQQELSNFFQAIQAAGKALSPVLRVIGEDVVILLTSLTKLGTAIGPGITVFFQGLGQALGILGQAMIASAPAFNEFLAALGGVLSSVMSSIGPQLPTIFQNFATALINCAPALTSVAGAFANLFSHLTPNEIEAVLTLIGALKTLVPVLAALDAVLDANPVVLLIGAIAALAAGAIYAYTHFQTFHDIVNGFAQGVSGLLSTIGNLGSQIATEFGKVASGAFDWGKNLLTNFIHGMESMFDGVGDAASSVGQTIHNFLFTNSPAKQGPLNTNSPDDMGANVVSNFSSGITSNTDQVQTAAEAVAASTAKGFGGISGVAQTAGGNFLSPSSGSGQAFSSAGQRATTGGSVAGAGGSGVKGTSGFDQYVSNLTTDLSAWGKIAKDSFGLFSQVTGIVTQGLKIGASLWGGGVNPMTLPGGIFYTPGQPVQAPLPELTPQHYAPDNTPAVPQQSVPGVPDLPKQGTAAVIPPGTPTGTPAVPQQQTPGAPAGQAPDATTGYKGQDAALATELKAKGFTDSQIVGLVALNGVETGNWSHPESIMGFTNQQTGPGIAPHVAGFRNMWDSRQQSGAVAKSGDPDSGMDANGNVVDPSKYSSWLLKMEGYSATTDWAGNHYAPGQFMSPDNYASKVTQAYQNLPPANPPAGNVQGTVPPGPQGGAPVNPAGDTRGAVLGTVAIGGIGTSAGALAMRRMLSRRQVAAGTPGTPIQGLNVNASDPDAMVDVFHATDDAGAQGIAQQGFRQTGALPDAYFSRSLDMAKAMSQNYDLPRIMAGQVPASSLRPDDMTMGVRAPYQDIAGMPFRELGADEIASGVVRPPASVVGDAAGAADSAAGSSALGRLGSVAGRMLTPIAMAPFALDAARNIAGNQRVQGGTATWGDLLSGRGSTSAINNNPLQSRIDPNDPNTQLPAGVNRGQTSAPGTQGIPQSTIDLAARSGHPIPGTTPSSGIPGAPAAAVQGQAPGSGGQFTPQPYGLPKGTNTGGYGNPAAAGIFPQWVMDLGAQYGVKPSTYGSHQESNRVGEAGYAPNPQNQNRGIDWVGSREQMEAFAKALTQYGGAEGRNGALEQVIYQAGPGGTRYGLGGAGNINNVPHEQGGYYPQAGDGSYNEHGGLDTGAHVHTRFSGSVPANLGLLPGQSSNGPQVQNTTGAKPLDVNVAQQGGTPLAPGQPNAPQGVANAPVPGMTRAGPTVPENPMNEPTIAPQGGNAVPGMQRAGPTLPQNAMSEPTAGGGGITGQSETSGGSNTGGQSMMTSFGNAMSGVGTIAGDAFQVFDDVIKSIGSAANITDQLVRGFANTQDVVKFVQQFQQFITTAADVAKLVSDTAGTIGSFVGAGASGDPSGATAGVAAAFGTVSAISGLVNSALTAVNGAISLGIEVYQEVSKYQAEIEGFTLGNNQTGQLAGNVQMLLNTQTGQVLAYGSDDPLNKAVHNLPSWFSKAYGGNTTSPTAAVQNNQLNMYVGPGQSPVQMMGDSMWLVGTGAPSVASVAGKD